MVEKNKEKEGEKKPIIKVAFFKPRESWYRLPADERNDLWDKAADKYAEVGAKLLVTYCNCYWSNEEWPFFAVEQYPDVEAVKKFEDWLMERGWHVHIDSKLYLGSPMEIEETLNIFVKQQI